MYANLEGLVFDGQWALESWSEGGLETKAAKWPNFECGDETWKIAIEMPHLDYVQIWSVQDL